MGGHEPERKQETEREGGHVSGQGGDGWVVPWGPEISPALEATTTEPGATEGSFSLPQRACSKARAAWILIGAIHSGARGKASFILHHPLPRPGNCQQKARCPVSLLTPYPLPPTPTLASLRLRWPQAVSASAVLILLLGSPGIRKVDPEGCFLWGLRDPERDNPACFPFTW